MTETSRMPNSEIPAKRTGEGGKHESLDMLIFDMGHVFIDFEWEQVCHGFCTRLQISQAEFSTALQYLGTLGYERGEINTREFLAELNRVCRGNIDESEFCSLWNATFRENPHMIALINDLRERFPIYLLSNTNEVHFDFIESSFGISRYFDKMVLSYEVGSTKPDSRIYREVLSISGYEAERCLFIDDLIDNVSTARSIGMNAVQFVGIEQLLDEMEAFAIAPTNLSY